jgi:hypothetical protein
MFSVQIGMDGRHVETLSEACCDNLEGEISLWLDVTHGWRLAGNGCFVHRAAAGAHASFLLVWKRLLPSREHFDDLLALLAGGDFSVPGGERGGTGGAPPETFRHAGGAGGHLQERGETLQELEATPRSFALS